MPSISSAGRTSLGPSRSLVRDLLHAARADRPFSVERRLRLGDLDALRRASPARVSWSALFLKAWALVAAEHPVLRSVYRRYPWPHRYEHPEQVARLAIHRRFEGEDWVLFGRFLAPERTRLVALQERLDEFQGQPVPRAFRRQLALARSPLPLRRLAWWTTLHLSGAKRCKRLGTYSISSVAGHGALLRDMPCVTTALLTYGPVERGESGGTCRVVLYLDHRLVDGAHGARYLGELEERLCGPVRDELEALAIGEELLPLDARDAGTRATPGVALRTERR